MRKPFHQHFRFKRVRGYWYVIYKEDPGHPKSTGIRVEIYPDASNNESDAVNWAYANMHFGVESTITVRKFAKDFFDPEGCAWTRRKLLKAGRNDRRPFNSAYLPQNRGRLKNYILPRFGSVPLYMITTKAIDEWLMDLDSVRSGLPLSTSSLDKILNALRIILGEAKYQGYTQGNPAGEVSPFDSWSGPKRKPFILEEIRLLFPEDLREALRIWQSHEWYAYFLMEWTCGLRPQEVSAFMLKDWNKRLHGAIISRRIENSTLTVLDGLKTTERGMTVKPVIFSDRLEWILSLLEEKSYPTDELLFRSVNNKIVSAETSNKHFKASADRAGVELTGRTQYCLRHTYYTELLKRISEEDVERMAGHRSLRREYDHRKGIDFLKKAQPLREVINELSA